MAVGSAASGAEPRTRAGSARPGARTRPGDGARADGRARARPRTRTPPGGARIRRQLRLTTPLAVQLPHRCLCSLDPDAGRHQTVRPAVALHVGERIVLGRPREPAPQQALDRRLLIGAGQGGRDGHLEVAALVHLRPGARAHAQPRRPAAVEDRAAVDQPRRAGVRGEHALDRAELGIDPRAVVLDEGRRCRQRACAQRRHHLDPARPHGDAQPPGPRAAPEVIRGLSSRSGQGSAPRLRRRSACRAAPLSLWSGRATIGGRRMAYATTDDGVRLYYEEHGRRRADRVRARVRRRPPQLGAAGAVLQPPPPLHRLRRARLSALGRARARRELLAEARRRRHPRGDGWRRDRAGARRRPVDGRASPRCTSGSPGPSGRCRWSRPASATAPRRTREAEFRQGAEQAARGFETKGSRAFAEIYGSRRRARAVRGQGPARLARVRRPAGGALAARRGQYDARRAGEAAVACTTSRTSSNGSPCRP